MLTLFKKTSIYIALLPFLVGIIILSLPENPEKIRSKQLQLLHENLQEEIKNLNEDAATLLFAAEENRMSFDLILAHQKYPFVVYKNGVLEYWNNYHIVPEYRYVMGEFDLKFLRMPGGQYLGKKWKRGDYEIVGLIPLYKNSRIENQYLAPGYNGDIFPFNPERIVEPTFDTGIKVCIEDQCLFQIAIDGPSFILLTTAQKVWAAYLLLFSFIALVCLIFVYRQAFYQRWGIMRGVAIMFGMIIIPRFIMLITAFPRDFLKLSLFDTNAFASSWLNPTLGDLLLNFIILLLFAIIIFEQKKNLFTSINRRLFRAPAILFLGMLYFTSALLLFLVIQTIYNNSQIRLDITQSLSFDWLRISSYILLLIISAITFLIGNVVIKLLQEAFSDTKSKFLMLGVPFVIFILISVYDNLNYLIPVCIAAGIMITSVYSGLFKSLGKIRFASYIYVFSWLFASSIIIAYATMQMEEKKEYENQVRFAEKFLLENDALAEYLLQDLSEKIENDLFIQIRLSSPYPGKDVIKDKIRQVYLGGYFDKYDVSIYLFDSKGQPYNARDFMLRPSDIRMNNRQYQTEHKNIYYIDNPDDELAGRYLNIIELKKRGLRVGYILLDLQLKRIIPENVYPELLVDHRFLQPFHNKQYSYGLIRDGHLVYSSGKFDYEGVFRNDLFAENDSIIFRAGVRFADYQHRAVKDSEGNVYVISVPAHGLSHFFSNFSFFFLFVVFVVILFSFIYAIYFIVRGSELYYSARIQLYLSLAFFIPMLIVTIITLSLVSRSFKSEVNREYEEKAQVMARNIADELSNGSFENQLINVLLRASKYANADANIFSPNGRLLETTQPMIYENNLLAPYINPLALLSIRDKKQQMFTAYEAVGALDFNTTYYSIRSPESGEMLGILSVPYFESEAALDRNEIDIFTNIISIFTLIFILFLVVSYLASEYLIFPLKIITRKLQDTSLEFNEPLSWEANDEIGLMVREYNKMVINLEESKKALARTEKESAWREMAQQVAHEIKNPLTPMKLTLQHMLRTLSSDNNNEKYRKSLNALLHQVDTLSEIAGSFSSFARMPAPSRERFDLQLLIQKAISLFTNTEGLKIHYKGVRTKLFVEADEQLMGRILSNILINAIEAGEGYHPLEIMIKTEVVTNHRVQLQISDNGPGIEANVREKIFMPHFSTKKTGSGIGLAIARRGIEHAGGEIWFETEEGNGTTFFILLPLADE